MSWARRRAGPGSGGSFGSGRLPQSGAARPKTRTLSPWALPALGRGQHRATRTPMTASRSARSH
eukprot:807172-Lingulodinium_polyedra.AAC.1